MDEPVKPLTMAVAPPPPSATGRRRYGFSNQKISARPWPSRSFFRPRAGGRLRVCRRPRHRRAESPGGARQSSRTRPGRPGGWKWQNRSGCIGEQRPFLLAVIGFGQRPVDFKMVAPAGEFHAIIAHFFDERQRVLPAEDRPIGR